MSDSLWPHGLYSPWNSSGQNTGVTSLSPGDLPNPGIKPRSPTLQADSLPAKPQGKPKNTGVGSLSFLQWIFLTQESHRGLLHAIVNEFKKFQTGSQQTGDPEEPMAQVQVQVWRQKTDNPASRQSGREGILSYSIIFYLSLQWIVRPLLQIGEVNLLYSVSWFQC